MRLVVFDVDGTLVDSQGLILTAMDSAFAGAGLAPLPREQVLSIVGLSLPVAVAHLLPGALPEQQDRVVEGYKTAYAAARSAQAAPLYPGVASCLDRLATRDDLLLAVATGKSRRGLDAVIATHGWQGRFISLQTADGHPSKPHPSMLHAAMSDAGVGPADAVMIGDTSFDMQMAGNAGMAGFGVAWGYHTRDALIQTGAARIFDDFASLTQAIEEWSA